jgi:outer membrane lipopolysaccharide assembly protein LptE/RlpB
MRGVRSQETGVRRQESGDRSRAGVATRNHASAVLCLPVLVYCLLTPAVCLLLSCGYHVAGHADLVPKTDHTIAIPAFTNITVRYKITDWLPEALSKEFIARTRYKIVSDPKQADMVLKGTVASYSSFPTTFNPATNSASTAEVHVVMTISLEERATGKTLFTRPRLEVTDRYQISLDPTQYFEESDDALARASQVVARQVVSAILNNF